MFLLIKYEIKKSKEVQEEVPSIKEIIENIKNIKQELIEKYQIEKMYLYGSIASNKATKQSDIDLVIKYQENCLNNEINNRYQDLLELLQTTLKYKEIDLIHLTTALYQMELSAMEKVITLI